MAIRWDPPDIDEIKESLEDTSNLTLCSTYFIPTRNTLLITVAVTFPDYAQLENGKEIYNEYKAYADKHNISIRKLACMAINNFILNDYLKNYNQEE